MKAIVSLVASVRRRPRSFTKGGKSLHDTPSAWQRFFALGRRLIIIYVKSFHLRGALHVSEALLRYDARRGKLLHVSNASVNFSSAQPPPGANPRALAFFIKWENSAGWGHISCLNAPGWGQRKRQMPRPRDPLLPTLLQFFINQWIISGRSTVQYFNATVLKTSRTTVRVSRFWLYLFLYIFVFNSLL